MALSFPRRSPAFSFDLDSVPKAWFADDPVATVNMIAMSISFPDGERFFIESVRAFRDELKDEELRARVTAFIGQEAMHGKVHRAFNALLRAQGFDRDKSAEHRLLTFERLLDAWGTPELRLAYTAGVEHWTAIFGENFLTRPAARAAFHPSVVDLWAWHALEETEHRAVAFDVYQAVSGNYPVRVGMMFVASFAFLVFGPMVQGKLLLEGGYRLGLRAQLEGMRKLLGRGSLFEGFFGAWARYFSPTFHPDERDASELVREWRERLFGADGPLAGTTEAWS